MKRMPIAIFNDRALAEPIRARLAQAGIAAEVHDDLGHRTLWATPKPARPVRIEVPASEFERGEQLLVDWDAQDGSLQHAIHCPECKSLLVQYPQATDKSVLTNVAMGVASQLGIIDRQYYCQDCHFTWPREGTAPRPGRPNMAPYYFIDGVLQPEEPGVPQL